MILAIFTGAPPEDIVSRDEKRRVAWGVVMMLERCKRGGKICRTKMEGGKSKQ